MFVKKRYESYELLCRFFTRKSNVGPGEGVGEEDAADVTVEVPPSA